MASKSNNQTLGIIIPMYNEEKGAGQCIGTVMKYLAYPHVKTNLIIVNDGSSDNTLAILKKHQKKHKNKLVIATYQNNKGYGGALQLGIKEADKLKMDYILFMDSDLTNNPKYIADFVKEMPKGYDCVKASRFVKGGKMVGIPFKRSIFSTFGNIIIRNMFRIGIRDCTNGFRMVKLEKIKRIRFQENNFSIILEELYYLKKSHATFYEIPTILTTRKKGKSNFFYTPALLFDYAKYAIKAFFII